MNSENSKTSDPHRLLLNLSDKTNLTRHAKYVTFSNLRIYYSWKNTKTSYKNNKFKISGSTWNEKFDLLDRSYSVSDIQHYFKYIIKKHETVIDNSPIRIYVNQIENRISHRMNIGYYLELLTAQTLKLLGSTKNKITKGKNGENVSHLEITEVVLGHCNIVNNDYQEDSRVLYTFVRNESFGQ